MMIIRFLRSMGESERSVKSASKRLYSALVRYCGSVFSLFGYRSLELVFSDTIWCRVYIVVLDSE